MWWRQCRQKILGDTHYKKLSRIYFVVILIGAIILFLPISVNADKYADYTLFDAVFISISAFTNTGLTTKTIADTMSAGGQVVILILIQLGGIGFLTILILLWRVLSRNEKFTTENRFWLYFERGGSVVGEAWSVVKTGIYFLLITEIIGAIILSFFFYYVPAGNAATDSGAHQSIAGDIGKSIWAGVFHSISASNNAGFDILGSNSITPYRNDVGNILSVVLLIQSFIGGIGYPVFYDVFQWFKKRRHQRKRVLTLFTKIALLMYVVLSCLSVVSVLLIELPNSNSFVFTVTTDNKWGENQMLNKLWNMVYLTFSARSAGFAGMEISELSDKSKWLLSVLMFIGASPESTGGGIRTITLFLIILKIWQTISGRKHMTMFNRTIKSKDIDESMLVFLFSIFLVVIFAIILPGGAGSKMSNIFFECSSAFGTAGLTSNITENTDMFGRILLLILMFCGQLGISNTLLAWTGSRPDKKNLQFLHESIRII